MRFTVAIAISVVVHLLIGLGLWAYMEYAPAPDVLATLDLSSVELSFAENEDDTAAVLPRLPSPQLTPSVPEKTKEPEPKSEKLPELPPIPDAVEIPKPEDQPEVQTPELAKSEKKQKKVEPQPQPSTSTLAPAPKQAKIDAPPRPKRTIKPDYPKGSRQRGEQGDVLLEMTVNSQGNVEKAAIITSSGYSELDEAALRAVRAARFSPAKSGGKPVSSSARITLTFKLK